MIDLHCHILPAIDDGPADLDMSVDMARLAAADGITTVVATPHIKNSICPPELIVARTEELNKRLVAEGIGLAILPGAEVYALQDPRIFRSYTLNKTGYVLVEFPYGHMPRNAQDILFNLQAEGLLPIISHPERNPSVLENPRLLGELVDTGALVQVTAGSVTGDFGPECKECTLFLLRQGWVHCIASDAHSPLFRRPLLSGAVRTAAKIIGEEKAGRLVRENPAAVIGGEELGV